jgi:hypothetical protein
MKNLTRSVVTLSFFVVLAATSALAQGRTRVTADIPFDFTVGEKSMPAGKYIVQKHPTTNNLLLVTSREANKSAYAMFNDRIKSRGADKTVLVFHRYGNDYFLSQMWAAGESTGTELQVSKAERKARKGADRNIAQNLEPELITVVVD